MRISTNQIYERGANNLIAQQEKALKLQEQLSSGVRVQNPSDDPIASSQIELINQRLNNIQIMQTTNKSMTSSLNLEQGVLSSATTTIQSLQNLQVQAGNAALSKEDRQSLAVDAQNLLNQLLEYANSTDANGNYLFAGSKSNILPITKTFDSSANAFIYNYNGDDLQRFQAVSDNLQVAINDTGDNIFMKIPAGNGSFSIGQPSPPNTGTAIVSTGAVTNPSAYTPGDFTMTFNDNAGVLEVTVTNNNGGAVLYNAPYQEGSAITFNGMSMNINGTPADGDNFLIESSTKDSIFSTVQRMVANLNAPYENAIHKAAIQNENNQLLTQLSNALSNISNYNADVGGRLNQLESVSDANDNLSLIAKDTLKKLREIDPAAVAVQYNLQLVNLQAAQQSFVRIQGLSVFNYL